MEHTKSKVEINKSNTLLMKTYIRSYQHINNYKTNKEPLNYKLTILKLSAASPIPTIRLNHTMFLAAQNIKIVQPSFNKK